MRSPRLAVSEPSAPRVPLAPGVIALPLRLDVDRRAVRDTRRLRAAAAVIAILGSVWLAATQNHWLVGGLAVLTGVYGVFWLRRGLREQDRALQADHHVLLDLTGITLHDGPRTTHIVWTDVAAVVVDEDRIVVSVMRSQGEPLRVEPIFGGLGVYELRDTIQRAASMGGDADTGRTVSPDATPLEGG